MKLKRGMSGGGGGDGGEHGGEGGGGAEGGLEGGEGGGDNQPAGGEDGGGLHGGGGARGGGGGAAGGGGSVGGSPSWVVDSVAEDSTTTSGRPASTSNVSNEMPPAALPMADAALAEAEWIVIVRDTLAAATSMLMASGATPMTVARRSAKDAMTFGVKSTTSPAVTS